MNKEQLLSQVQIRQATLADAASIARVSVDSWRTTYRDLLSEEYLQSLSYKQKQDQWLARLSVTDGSLFAYVALNSRGKIIGFASGGVERAEDAHYQGELYALYLLDSAQRQGLGRRLLLSVARHLVQEGITNMLIWVLAENPARRFYEAMGGRYVREQPITIGQETVSEVAYGWEDLPLLLREKEI